MKAVILAGGFGTRLSEKTDVIPKPMIEIGGKPLLWHIMKNLSQHGINDFIIALGYKGEVIKRYFLEYPNLVSDLEINWQNNSFKTTGNNPEPWNIQLIDTGDNVMTGGRLARLKQYLPERFLFTYGDGLSNININSLVEFHRSHGKLATVTAVSPVSKFGILDLTDNTVNSFSEKPLNNEQRINGGYFILEPEVIGRIAGDSTRWEKEPCEKLATDGQLMAYKHDGFWQCIDTLHELRQLRGLWEMDAALWKTW